MGLRNIIELAATIQAAQLVDSSLASTRVFWRRKLGYSEDVVHDPRPLADLDIPVVN